MPRGRPFTPDETILQYQRLAEQYGNKARAAREVGISYETAKRISRGTLQPSRSAIVPFSGQPQGPAKVPPPAWGNDTTQVPQSRAFDRRYHGHTFQAFSAPYSFDGWDLSRIRNAISQHRLGLFLESSTLAQVVLGFAPVLAAVGQRMAPAIALPRKFSYGNRGLARVLGEQLEQQISPQMGLYPSEYMPTTLFGETQFDLGLMGFSVWQHVFGDPDPETGVMSLYTRRWPLWAVQYYRYRRTFVAITTDGPVDICNDGKFTLIADREEPHFNGALLAIAEEALDGITTRNARGHYIDAWGSPKLIATMPDGIAPNSPEGQLFLETMQQVRMPDGRLVMPFGSTLDFAGLDPGKSTVIKDALDSVWQNVAAALLGSDGTMTRGTGVYSAPIFAGVRRDLVDRDLHSIIRGVNQGHCATYLRHNYAQSIAEASGWSWPAFDIPLPDPDADARINSYAERMKKFHEIIDKERADGYLVTQERSDQVAASLEIDPPQLAPMDKVVARIDLAPTDIAKVVKVKEARMAQGLPELGDERDEMTIAELDALSKSKANPETQPESTESPNPEGDSTEPEPPSNSEGGSNGGETKEGSADSASATK